MSFDYSILLTIGGSLLTALTTVAGILLKGYISRLKLAQNEYASIIKSNASFRDEIRRDLVTTKNDLEKALNRIDELKLEIETSRTVIFRLECQIKIKDEQIDELNRQIFKLQNKS